MTHEQSPEYAEQDFETVRKELAWAQSQVIRATQMRSTALDRADAALSRIEAALAFQWGCESALEDARQERDALKAALEEHWDHDDVWCFACHQSIEEFSARQALGELEEE